MVEAVAPGDFTRATSHPDDGLDERPVCYQPQTSSIPPKLVFGRRVPGYELTRQSSPNTLC